MSTSDGGREGGRVEAEQKSFMHHHLLICIHQCHCRHTIPHPSTTHSLTVLVMATLEQLCTCVLWGVGVWTKLFIITPHNISRLKDVLTCHIQVVGVSKRGNVAKAKRAHIIATVAYCRISE